MTKTQINHNSINFGAWPSAISAELIAGDSISIDEPRLTTHASYYIERRPAEKGRCVIVQMKNKQAVDLLPKPYSARSRVHEYGGGSYCVSDETIFFVNDQDQDIYQITNHQVTRITDNPDNRYADFCYDKHHQRLISICETHHNEAVSNTIVSINIKTGDITTLVEGNDFYASPRVNSTSTQLCWQTWNHPNMPWDGNQLWLANIDKGGNLNQHKLIAGSDKVSIFQPQWSPTDTLYYIADNTGWWHLYRYISDADKIEQLTDGKKEFGLPQWVFAQSSYSFLDVDKIICCYQQESISKLAVLSVSHSPAVLTEIETHWQEFSSITATNNMVCFLAASSLSFPQLMTASVDLDKFSLDNISIIKQSCDIPLSDNYYSPSEVISFTNRHQQTVYANYYAPTNPDVSADKNGKPPLIVISHGGPTGQTSIALDPKKQFWTSRGFALLDVNYSGSTGYGKAYRSRLDGNWGALDVEDCCDAALFAVEQGLANPQQLIIRGSSAGGYTVLSALTFQQVFSAGASYYGISELTSLATDTHKFEARYLDKLIGPYPESKDMYEQLSPINSAEQLNCPVIFFQGVDDKVVPKAQAEKMFRLLDEKGLTVAAQYFEGEQHGFRKASTIVQSLENELNFYQLIFNLVPEDAITFSGDIQLSNTPSVRNS